MTRKTLFLIQDHPVTVLRSKDSPLLQGYLENCTDYFELVQGCPPAASTAQELLLDLPPGKTLKDKFVLGLWEPAGSLIGVLDAVRDYPGQGGWFVRLLLIDPACRQHGLGRKLYQAFEQWAFRQGAQQIGLGVVEQIGRPRIFGRVSASSWWRNSRLEDLERRKMSSL